MACLLSMSILCTIMYNSPPHLFVKWYGWTYCTIPRNRPPPMFTGLVWALIIHSMCMIDGGHRSSSIHYKVTLSLPIYCPNLFCSILWLPLTHVFWICVLAISQWLRLVSYLRPHNNIYWILPNPCKIFHILVYTTVHIWLLSFLRTHNNTVHRLHVSHVVLSDCSHISWEPAPTTLLNYLVTLVCSTSKAISWERTPMWCLPYLGNC